MLPPSFEQVACREALRKGSKSFHAASLLLPKRVRDPATALYAFCREADDAVDLGGGGDGALAGLHDRLDRIYAGRPNPSPVDTALAGVVARFALPRPLLDALLEGFAWDAQGRRYETLDDLEAYAARVAGTVGAMMATLMGERRPALIARACDLGVAMQFTNIARDVGEDARAGRLYLPGRWLAEEGVDADAFLARPVFSARLGAVVQRLLGAADLLYRRADAGIDALPRSCRPGIRTARLIYAEIGSRIAAGGFDSVSARSVVPRSRKLALGLRALRAMPHSRELSVPPSSQTRFLVEVAAQAGTRLSVRPRSVTARALWLLDLFERLERRDDARASQSRA
jgi:phytoene synthase